MQSALIVVKGPTATTPFNLRAQNFAKFQDLPNIGLIDPNYNPTTLAYGSSSFVRLGGVADTPPGSRAQGGSNSATKTEDEGREGAIESPSPNLGIESAVVRMP